MEFLLEALLAALEDPVQLTGVIAFSTLVNTIFFFNLNKVFRSWSLRQPWYEQVVPLQKQMMANLGYSEEDLTPAAVLETWSFVLVSLPHHFTLGLFTLPAVFLGYEENPVGQLLFIAAVLGEMGFELYDVLRMTIVRKCPAVCPSMTPVPLPFYVMTCLHHSLGLVMGIPVVQWYGHRWEVRWIVSSLLLAAAASFATGAYKFTLNTRVRADFVKYKAIVVFQFTVMWCTRCFLWFYAAVSLGMHFWEDGNTSVFRAALFVMCTFSAFNLVLLADVTKAAIKWMPRSMPKTEDQTSMQSTASGRGSQATEAVPSQVAPPVLLGSGVHRPSMCRKVTGKL